MIKLLLADDHAIVREGLKQLLAMTKEVQVVAEASNGNEVLEFVRKDKFDVLLLDMSMPGISGINLIIRLQSVAPSLPIVMLTMHNDPQIVRRVAKAGVAGYLTKDCEPESLLSAIKTVVKGRRFIDPALADRFMFELGPQENQNLLSNLSPRESEVFHLLAQGISVNEIAQRLTVSNKTISTHKMRLMQKMQFKNNSEIVRYAIENGFLDI